MAIAKRRFADHKPTSPAGARHGPVLQSSALNGVNIRRTNMAQESTPAGKALRTAKWARIMTKWMISHSSKGGVKWQVVSFNGRGGQESKGIVDMIAIRKNHNASTINRYRGDLFEIILVQIKGGSARFPSKQEIARLIAVKQHHRADKVVLAEWKPGERLCCYLLPNTIDAIPASEIFGNVPSKRRLLAETATATSSPYTPLAHGRAGR